MPNWCDNEVTITHNDKDVINGIVEAIKKEQGLFQHILPVNDFEDRVKKWGTKWDAQEVQICEVSDSSIFLSFETAWAPPVELYRYMVNNGYEICSLFAERGCDFCGQFTDGVLEEYDIDGELPEYLLEYVTKLGYRYDSDEDED